MKRIIMWVMILVTMLVSVCGCFVPWDDGGRGGDDDEVRLLREVGKFGIRLDAEHAGPGGVDRVDRAAERRVHQVPQNGAADAADLFRGAHDGDGFRQEDGIEGMPANLAVQGAEGFLNGGSYWSTH